MSLEMPKMASLYSLQFLKTMKMIKTKKKMKNVCSVKRHSSCAHKIAKKN